MTTSTEPHRTPVIRRTHLEARLGFFGPIIAPLLTWIMFRRARFTYGMELVVDLKVPDKAVITDPAELQRFTDLLVDVIEMEAHPIAPDRRTWIEYFGDTDPAHFDTTAGYTLIQPIKTSSIVFHFSDGKLTVHGNVFSCKNFDPRVALEFIEWFFHAEQTTYTVIARG